MTLDEIDKLVNSNKVVLFMKGNPTFPQCGFSQRAVAILQASGVEDFVSCDVLADDELRENVKQYSDWPTIPQLYVSGEFIGGCDIMMEMYQSGEITELLSNVRD
jgi:monothiol glutaredoxin